MIAGLDDAAVIEHDDLAGVTDGGQAVCDGDGGPAPGQGVERLLHGPLGLRVQRASGLVEHEYPDARIQDPKKLAPVLKGSIAFTRAIDEAAANMIALQKVIESQGIKVQGVGREAYRS